MRIIGGRWKRTPIPVPDLPGLRPTPDRVRETVFNWLGQDLTGWRCLDLYAGTGALGLEAASRGAAQVVFVEREPRAVQALRRLCERLGPESLQIVQADASSWLERWPGTFDLVLLDPPFQSDALQRLLPRVSRVLAPGGLVYVESPQALADPRGLLAALSQWELHRAGRAGQVHYHLLRHARADAPAGPSELPQPGA